MTMEIFFAFHTESAEAIQDAGSLAWSTTYAEQWPNHFHKKWIPMAPSTKEACRSLRNSPAYQADEHVSVLQVNVPISTWNAWEENGTIVRNPGPRRKGNMHTD